LPKARNKQFHHTYGRQVQNKQLSSSGNGSWPLMAGLNKIMKDDEII
jgi:hypothetical protein